MKPQEKITQKVKQVDSLPQVVIAPMGLAQSLIESVHPNLEWKYNALPQTEKKQNEKVAIILYSK